MSKEKKAPAPKKMKNDQANQLILAYLNKENRPYNHKMVFENIHGKDKGLSAKNVEDRLASLAKEGLISMKLFKNKPLYWPRQDRYETLDATQLQALEREVKELKEKDADLKKQVTEQRRINDILASEPTDAELSSKLDEAEAECARLSKRLDSLKSNAKALNPEQKKKLQAKYEATRQEWRGRKRKFQDICDTFEENGALDQKKLKKLKANIGIETDEDAKVNFADDKTSKLLPVEKKPVGRR